MCIVEWLVTAADEGLHPENMKPIKTLVAVSSTALGWAGNLGADVDVWILVPVYSRELI